MANEKPTSSEGFRPDFLENAKEVKSALQRLKSQIERQHDQQQEKEKDPAKVFEPISLDPSFQTLKSALEKAKGNPAMEEPLEEEMTAIAQAEYIPALIRALSNKEGTEKEKVIRNELEDLGDEITGVSNYLKSFPPPSIFDRIADAIHKLDPTVREFILNFLEGISLAGIITGPVRWRKALEEALESEDVKNNEEYKKKLNDPLELTKVKKEWTVRYTRWQNAKANVQKAKKENRTVEELKFEMPTVLAVLQGKPDPMLEQKPPEVVSTAPQAPGVTPPAAPAVPNPPATNQS